VHAPIEGKVMIQGLQNLQRAFNKFLIHHMHTVSGDFNAKKDREDVFKPTLGNVSCLKMVMIMELQ
jgi:hypothetical protein